MRLFPAPPLSWLPLLLLPLLQLTRTCRHACRGTRRVIRCDPDGADSTAVLQRALDTSHGVVTLAAGQTCMSEPLMVTAVQNGGPFLSACNSDTNQMMDVSVRAVTVRVSPNDTRVQAAAECNATLSANAASNNVAVSQSTCVIKTDDAAQATQYIADLRQRLAASTPPSPPPPLPLPPSASSLSALAVGVGPVHAGAPMTPAYKNTTTSYKGAIPAGTTQVTVTATPTTPGATIKLQCPEGHWIVLHPGTASQPVNLSATGSSDTLTLTVTSADTIASTAYSVVLAYPPVLPSEVGLASISFFLAGSNTALQLVPPWNSTAMPGSIKYSVHVPDGEDRLKLRAAALQGQPFSTITANVLPLEAPASPALGLLTGQFQLEAAVVAVSLSVLGSDKKTTKSFTIQLNSTVCGLNPAGRTRPCNATYKGAYCTAACAQYYQPIGGGLAYTCGSKIEPTGPAVNGKPTNVTVPAWLPSAKGPLSCGLIPPPARECTECTWHCIANIRITVLYCILSPASSVLQYDDSYILLARSADRRPLEVHEWHECWAASQYLGQRHQERNHDPERNLVLGKSWSRLLIVRLLPRLRDRLRSVRQPLLGHIYDSLCLRFLVAPTGPATTCRHR